MLYFDFGGREEGYCSLSRRHQVLFQPETEEILSHLHRDHWIGANRCEEALEMEWVVPPQKKKEHRLISFR